VIYLLSQKNERIEENKREQQQQQNLSDMEIGTDNSNNNGNANGNGTTSLNGNINTYAVKLNNVEEQKLMPMEVEASTNL